MKIAYYNESMQAHIVENKGSKEIPTVPAERRRTTEKKSLNIVKADDQGQVSHAAHQLSHGPPELPARLWLL
jgi:hypothetical protein